MKILYIIIAFFIFIGCSTINDDSFESNPTISNVFSKSEIKDLKTLMIYFNEQICVTQQIEITKISDCYQSFFKRMSQATSAGDINIKIPFDDQQNIYKKISKTTFEEIWDFGKSWKPNSSDTLKHIHFKYDGKYMRFLEELGKDDKMIKYYLEAFKSAGDMSPSMVSPLLMNYENYNIEDIRIRLFVAIHYLTLNDKIKRIEKI